MQDYNARAKQGIKLLMGRQVCLQVLTFAGGVILARILGPAQFGLFAIATFLVNTLAMFGDFGLVPSFIQRKAELTERDLQVGFTLQQIITTGVVVILFIAAPWLARLYPKAPPETVWLVRTLAFTLFLSSWRSVSALQLERQLRYDRLAWIEVVESLSYQLIAVVLALLGHGVWSLVWATLIRAILGTSLAFITAPWTVRFVFDRKISQEVLRFGIPFQLQNLFSHAGDWISPLLVGSLIGPQAVGFLTWASSNGKKPLILVDNVMRVAFPHFSRLQDDKAEVERILLRYFTYLLLPSGLWFCVLLVAGPMLVQWIYTEKWMPGVPSLVLYSVALWFDVLSFVVVVTLNSLGFVGMTTRVMLVRTLIYIAVSIPLVLKFGFSGVPLGYILSMLVCTPWLFSGLGKGALQKLLWPSAWLCVPIGVSALVGEMLRGMPLPLKPHAIITVAITLLTYATVSWVAGPDWMKQTVVSKLTRRISVIGTPVLEATD